jgi:hypothetical protein
MDGSALAPIVIPIVALVFLFSWLAIVYHAAAHPSVHTRAVTDEEREAFAHAESAQEHPESHRRAA